MNLLAKLEAGIRRAPISWHAALIVAPLFALLLASCGGGGDSAPSPGTSAPVPAVTTSNAGIAEGLWRESFGGGYRYLLVESDGQLWGIPNATTFNLTAIQTDPTKGQILASANTVAGPYMDVASTSCSSVYTCKVSGVASNTTLSLSGGKTLGSSTVPGWTFAGSPDASYAAPASMSTFAGAWNVTAITRSSFSATGALTISSIGAVSTTGIDGCDFIGSLVPVSGKGYFRIRLTQVNGSCASGVTAAEVQGVAFLMLYTERIPILSFMWHGADSTKLFWGSGSK